MARQGLLSWGLFCAILVISLAATTSADDETDDAKAKALAEKEAKEKEICEEALAENTVKTMEECQANIDNNLNPDGTPKGVNCGDGLIVPI